MEAASVTYLRALFGAFERGHVLFWMGSDKRSEWLDLSKFEDELEYDSKISQAISSRRMRDNVYVALGVRPKEFGTFERGKADDVIGIPGVWADIDIAGDGHKKKNLPETREEVLDFLSSLPIRPTLVIWTGGGFHIYWLFKEPWIIENDADRAEMRDFSQRWQWTLKRRAEIRGWEMDSTYDLARIFRLPGTRNMKYTPAGEPTIVEIIAHDESARIEPSEIYSFLMTLKDHEKWESVDPSTVDASFDDLDVVKVRFSPEKKGMMFEADHRVELTWHRRRKDFKDDSSPSAYDLSLINYMLGCGWSDQEMVDGLMICRAENGEEEKFNRPDYYAYTIAKAKQSYHGEPTILTAKKEISAGIPITEPIEKLNKIFKFSDERLMITRWMKQDGNPPTYLIETTKGNVVGVKSTAIQNPKELNQAFIDQKNVAIPLNAKFIADWNSVIVQIILAAVIKEQGFGNETTLLNLIIQYLEDYLMDFPPAISIPEATRQRKPFVAKNRLYISPLHMKTWVVKQFEPEMKHQFLLTMLREYGAESVQLNVEVLGGKSNRTVWQLPDNAWTRDVVTTLLYEHLEKHGSLPPSATDGVFDPLRLVRPNGDGDYGEFGLINLTPQEDPWHSVVEAAMDAPAETPAAEDEPGA